MPDQELLVCRIYLGALAVFPSARIGSPVPCCCLLHGLGEALRPDFPLFQLGKKRKDVFREAAGIDDSAEMSQPAAVVQLRDDIVGQQPPLDVRQWPGTGVIAAHDLIGEVLKGEKRLTQARAETGKKARTQRLDGSLIGPHPQRRPKRTASNHALIAADKSLRLSR